MSKAASRAEVDAARAYEDLFVPALFGQWAPIVLDTAQVAQGHRVLDAACGTGVVAHILREAEEALKPYVGTDGVVMFDSPAHLISATKP